MLMHFLDPKDKTQLWKVEEQGPEFRVQKITQNFDECWQVLPREAVCQWFECENWQALYKLKVKTEPYNGWVGFGYRRSAYTTWLVYAYLRRHPVWRGKIDRMIEPSSCLSKNADGVEVVQCCIDDLTSRVKEVGEQAFIGLHSLSSYADVEMTNWRELTLNWQLDV
ncbi:hypothetical protein [Vibrio mexicanus]|uniref:hypothetical protein n=1 Tax=Vibrio mexicanus TaxID=1004326 RepID=UPI00063C8F6C|nr:hypothetical protein [Vibrio mexicanus]